GFNAEEFKKLSDINFLDFLDIQNGMLGVKILNSTPMLIVNALWSDTYQGKVLHTFIKNLLETVLGDAKATFADLSKKIEAGADPLLKDLIVTGTTEYGKPLRFSKETTPTYRIADAVMASASVPGFFRPRVVRDAEGKPCQIAVDGGVLDNFPSNILDDEMGFSKNHPIIRKFSIYGLSRVNEEAIGVTIRSLEDIDPKIAPVPQRILERKARLPKRDRVIWRYANNGLPWVKNRKLFKLFTLGLMYVMGNFEPENIDRESALHPGQIIQVCDENVSTLDFALTPEKKKALIDNGRDTAEVVLASLLDPTKAYSHPEAFIPDIPEYSWTRLSKYLQEFVEEIEKYNAGLPHYKMDALTDNVKLQYLANLISGIVPSLPLHEKAKLNPLFADVKQRYDARQTLVMLQRKTRKQVIDKKSIVAQLMLFAKNKDLKKFQRLFRAQLSMEIEVSLFAEPGSLNLIETVLATDNTEIFRTMLTHLKSRLSVLSQQDRAPKFKNDRGEFVSCDSLEKLLNFHQNFKKPLLEQAIEANALGNLEILLSEGADPISDKGFASRSCWQVVPDCKNQKTALHTAIACNNYYAFKILYAHNPIGLTDVRFEPDGDTLLHTMLKTNWTFALCLLEEPLFQAPDWDWDIPNYQGLSCRQLIKDKKGLIQRFGISPQTTVGQTFWSAATHFCSKI
ncbi:MAG TPA: patatin-like phospholipase family protein, partial [Gammaproteobacteria bacterium]|nr:patatin-like phospholipase family protein [Gammaproteobacteria bacterium]